MRTKVNQKKNKQATRVSVSDNSCKSCSSLHASAPDNLQQQKQVDTIESSSLLTLQQKKLDSMFGSAVQREEKLDEEMLQPKLVAQRDYADEASEESTADKSISGSFQAKISSDDAEELTQQKTIQRQAEEEEELPGQAKLMNQSSVQLQLEEEEELPGQGKFTEQSTAQMQLEEEEELPGQGKFSPLQKQKNSTGMSDEVKSKMESSFNTDFSGVKVHANSSKAPEVGALAYTQGHDVHFAPGQFKPESSTGQQLLGHELAHVVQQREGRVQPTTEIAGLPVNDNPSLENEADVLGAKASR